jgi:hypothetical protein
MNRIAPGIAPRLEFFVTDATTGAPVPALTRTDISGCAYVLQTAGIRAAPVAVSLIANVANTAAVSAGQFVTIDSANGHYAVDAPEAAALSAADSVEIVVTLSASGRHVHAVAHEIDLRVSLILAAIGSRLSGSAVNVVSRVATGGRLLVFVGDDWKTISGTQQTIPVSDPAGALYAKLNALGVGALSFGAARPGTAAGAITGTVVSLAVDKNEAVQRLLIGVELTAAGVGLQPADNYRYQIQQTQTHGAATHKFVEVAGSLTLEARTVV